MLPSGFPDTPFADSVRLLWAVHDRFQRASSSAGTISNLSDEMILLFRRRISTGSVRAW